MPTSKMTRTKSIATSGGGLNDRRGGQLPGGL